MKSMTFSFTRCPFLLLLLVSLNGCQSTKDFFGMDGEQRDTVKQKRCPLKQLYALGKQFSSITKTMIKPRKFSLD